MTTMVPAPYSCKSNYHMIMTTMVPAPYSCKSNYHMIMTTMVPAPYSCKSNYHMIMTTMVPALYISYKLIVKKPKVLTSLVESLAFLHLIWDSLFSFFSVIKCKAVSLFLASNCSGCSQVNKMIKLQFLYQIILYHIFCVSTLFTFIILEYI